MPHTERAVHWRQLTKVCATGDIIAVHVQAHRDAIRCSIVLVDCDLLTMSACSEAAAD